MSEPNDDITSEPRDGPRRSDFTDEPRRGDDTYDRDRRPPPPKKSNTTLIVVLSLLVASLLLCLPAILLGLLIPAIAKVREAAARATSQNNLMQIGMAMQNCAMTSPGGELPPSNGPYLGKNGSFFYHLLPYVEQPSLYQSPMDAPVKTYIAPADKRNPNQDGTISYCTNGMVFQAPKPQFPNSFKGRTSSIICVMERSGMDGAHKWNNTNNVLGSPGSPPPFPQIGVDPSAYQGGSPHAFTSAGCGVLLADGSVRPIAKGQQNSWNWACDPANMGPMPADW